MKEKGIETLEGMTKKKNKKEKDKRKQDNKGKVKKYITERRQLPKYNADKKITIKKRILGGERGKGETFYRT